MPKILTTDQIKRLRANDSKVANEIRVLLKDRACVAKLVDDLEATSGALGNDLNSLYILAKLYNTAHSESPVRSYILEFLKYPDFTKSKITYIRYLIQKSNLYSKAARLNQLAERFLKDIAVFRLLTDDLEVFFDLFEYARNNHVHFAKNISAAILNKMPSGELFMAEYLVIAEPDEKTSTDNSDISWIILLHYSGTATKRGRAILANNYELALGLLKFYCRKDIEKNAKILGLLKCPLSLNAYLYELARSYEMYLFSRKVTFTDLERSLSASEPSTGYLIRLLNGMSLVPSQNNPYNLQFYFPTLTERECQRLAEDLHRSQYKGILVTTLIFLARSSSAFFVGICQHAPANMPEIINALHFSPAHERSLLSLSAEHKIRWLNSLCASNAQLRCSDTLHKFLASFAEVQDLSALSDLAFTFLFLHCEIIEKRISDDGGLASRRNALIFNGSTLAQPESNAQTYLQTLQQLELANQLSPVTIKTDLNQQNLQLDHLQNLREIRRDLNIATRNINAIKRIAALRQFQQYASASRLVVQQPPTRRKSLSALPDDQKLIDNARKRPLTPGN